MNHHLRKELLALKQLDIDTRSHLLSEGRLYGDYAPELQKIHRENASALDKLTSKYGWPGISFVGLEGCRAAWLIAQHSICTPVLQRKFLALLINASEHGDVPTKQVAFLTDRIRFNENKPQVYGTVLDWNEKGELSCEVEDPATLDTRRKAVGLPPFRLELEKHREEVKSEGGTPPKDFTEYKRKAREWASSVGWPSQA
jgi:hypothetical protein